MSVAQLHSSNTGHVASQFFLINSGEQVCGIDIGPVFDGASSILQVILGDVQSDVLHIGIHLNGLNDSASKSKAGQEEDVVAVSNGLVDHSDTSFGGVAGRLVVGEVDAAGFAPCLASLISGLVEGLVGDIAVVGDHCNVPCGVVNSGLFGVSGLGLGGSLSGVSGLGGSLSGVCCFRFGLGAANKQAGDHAQSQKQCKNFLHFLTSKIFVCGFTASYILTQIEEKIKMCTNFC